MNHFNAHLAEPDFWEGFGVKTVTTAFGRDSACHIFALSYQGDIEWCFKKVICEGCYVACWRVFKMSEGGRQIQS
jgi:hypothetical protein